jgi:hypothetical protein
MSKNREMQVDITKNEGHRSAIQPVSAGSQRNFSLSRFSEKTAQRS